MNHHARLEAMLGAILLAVGLCGMWQAPPGEWSVEALQLLGMLTAVPVAIDVIAVTLIGAGVVLLTTSRRAA